MPEIAFYLFHQTLFFSTSTSTLKAVSLFQKTTASEASRETDLDDINLVESEFFRWNYKWNNEFAKEKSVPESLTEAIKKFDIVVFPNLH